MYNKNSYFDIEIPRQSSINHHQNSPRQSSPTPDLTLLFSLTLITTVIMTLALSSLPKQKLENHPMCGVTTGGKDECYFDCELVTCLAETDIIVEDLSCIEDCFEDKPDNCVRALLKDVINNGICYDDPPIYTFNPNCDIEIVTYDDEEYPDYPDLEFIAKGTCSEETEELLQTDECLKIVFEQPEFIANTITTLIASSCSQNVSLYFFFFLEGNNLGISRSLTSRNRPFNKTRLAPAQFILENANIKTELQYENTRHRYPWVCSLRSLGPSPKHRCAVNLLSIPPSPTVVVGAAHCTYLCKDSKREVPVCCCSLDTDDCRETEPRCGDDPGLVEMTGSDSVIVCGEWDTSEATSVSSEERYNVKLPILEIIRHPDFDPEEGPLIGSDIVVFKVDDSRIQDGVVKTFELWPACLPSHALEVPKTGIQTGWSQPPPFPFVQSQAPGFARFYSDFNKQWHYKMDIFPTCEDPTESGLCGLTLTYPSNTSYPAGTVCAKDFTRQSCFSTGDSGSPLMVQYGNGQRKTYIEGILSFVKGCDQFQFGEFNDEFSDKSTFILRQKSENPTTYTKLSCFLPWIAAQYNMEYESTGSIAQACYTGSGDPQDGDNKCRNTHSNWAELRDDIEAECIFPFYYKEQRYDECILFNEEDFLYPIFRCPIRNITTKINGISSFNTSIGDSYCLSDEDTFLSTLDPSKTCGDLQKRPPFSQCKNNCQGVRALGIIGGGAVVAAVGTLGALSSFTPVLGAGALGAIGVGGMMVAETMCAAPFFCTIPSGKCCRVVFNINGLACPEIC